MKLAARAIILSQEKILLVQHKGSSFWSLPGGKLDDNEGMKQALKRELFEELGINAEIGKLRFINEFFYTGGSYSLEFFFEITNREDFEKELEGSHKELELEAVEWFDLKNLPEIMPKFLKEKLSTSNPDTPIEYFSTI